MTDLKGNSASEVGSLSGEEAEVWNLVRPVRGSLEKLKRLSMRRHAWFSVLSWKQRRLMDIVIRMVDRIRSPLLLRVLAPLVQRLLMAIGRGSVRNGALSLMEKGAYDMMRVVAERIVQVALKWGNKSAHQWLDEGFLKYLLVTNLPRNNNPMMVTC